MLVCHNEQEIWTIWCRHWATLAANFLSSGKNNNGIFFSKNKRNDVALTSSLTTHNLVTKNINCVRFALFWVLRARHGFFCAELAGTSYDYSAKHSPQKVSTSESDTSIILVTFRCDR